MDKRFYVRRGTFSFAGDLVAKRGVTAGSAARCLIPALPDRGARAPHRSAILFSIACYGFPGQEVMFTALREFTKVENQDWAAELLKRAGAPTPSPSSGTAG
jgi:hypothetical protein